MTEKTLTTENIKPALDALRGELAPWPVVAKKQDRLNKAQLNAANSGITSSLVAQIIANTAAIRALESAITGTGLRALVVSSLPAVGTTGILYIVPVTTYDPDTDADVVNYSNEYIWIPVEGGTASEGHYEQVGQTGIVINNGQLTITVNGTSVGTFTANQSGDTTAAITVPTNADYVDRTTNQTIAGTKTFSSTIDGTAAKAIADEDGTSIKTGYVNVAGNQTVTGSKDWSNLQTFSYSQIRIKSLSQEIGVTPSTSVIQYLEFADKNNVQHGKVGLWDYDNGASEIQMSISDKYKNGVKDATGTSDTAILSFGFQYNGVKFLAFSGQINNSVIPLATNSFSLGSSSYQWSSVYAQAYYYNGTAWGLDKANNWTGSNIFTGSVILPSFGSNNYRNYGIVTDYGYTQSNNYYRFLRTTGTYNTDNTPDTSKPSFLTFRPNRLQIELMDNVVACNSGTNSYIAPITTGVTDLGTSTNKWKTLNGINPGALSLPDYDSTAKVDIRGSITPDAYGNIRYTPPINGWLYVCFDISNATTVNPIFYIQAKDNNVANSSFVQTSWMPASGTGTSSLAIFFPVVANKQFVMQINFSNYTIIKAHVIPCLGNV